MAINENQKLDNHSRMFLGATRSGKSVALKQLIELSIKESKCPARVILWDPDRDHKASKHITNWAEFVRTTNAALKSGKEYRLAWAGSASRFNDWCDQVWDMLNGDHTIHIVIEELADVAGSGKATDSFGTLLRRAGKYNGRLMMVSQRPQEIPKTAYTQVDDVIIAKVKPIDANYIAKSLSIDAQAIMDIPAPEKDKPKKNQTTLHYLVSGTSYAHPEELKLVAK